MPPSGPERAVVVVGALVLGVLVWLIVGEWGRYTDRNDGSERRAVTAAALRLTAVQDRPSARAAAKAERHESQNPAAPATSVTTAISSLC